MKTVNNYPKKNTRNKYHKEVGLILNYCEIKIEKPDREVKYTHQQYIVIISNDKYYCVENRYGGLQLIERVASKYSSERALNKVTAYEQRWGIRSLNDYLVTSCISTFSEKVTKTRIKKALYRFIAKEAYFYDGLQYKIEQKLK